MITLTRINGQAIVINADLIRSVEANPDTTIMMINGDHIIVQESMQDIIDKVIGYGRELRRFIPPH
jgi:flagellar protein FlbD